MKVKELIVELLSYDMDKEIKILEETNNQFEDIDYVSVSKYHDELFINTTKEA